MSDLGLMPHREAIPWRYELYADEGDCQYWDGRTVVGHAVLYHDANGKMGVGIIGDLNRFQQGEVLSVGCECCADFYRPIAWCPFHDWAPVVLGGGATLDE